MLSISTQKINSEDLHVAAVQDHNGRYGNHDVGEDAGKKMSIFQNTLGGRINYSL